MLVTLMSKSHLGEEKQWYHIQEINHQLVFYDSVRLNSRSDKEVKSKHVEDSTTRFKDFKFNGKEEKHHVSRKYIFQVPKTKLQWWIYPLLEHSNPRT